MELVSMLAALLFLFIYVIGALIIEYFYEFRDMHQRLIQRLLGLLPFQRQSINDKNQ